MNQQQQQMAPMMGYNMMMNPMAAGMQYQQQKAISVQLNSENSVIFTNLDSFITKDIMFNYIKQDPTDKKIVFGFKNFKFMKSRENKSSRVLVEFNDKDQVSQAILSFNAKRLYPDQPSTNRIYVKRLLSTEQKGQLESVEKQKTFFSLYLEFYDSEEKRAKFEICPEQLLQRLSSAGTIYRFKPYYSDNQKECKNIFNGMIKIEAELENKDVFQALNFEHNNNKYTIKVTQQEKSKKRDPLQTLKIKFLNSDKDLAEIEEYIHNLFTKQNVNLDKQNISAKKDNENNTQVYINYGSDASEILSAMELIQIELKEQKQDIMFQQDIDLQTMKPTTQVLTVSNIKADFEKGDQEKIEELKSRFVKVIKEAFDVDVEVKIISMYEKPTKDSKESKKQVLITFNCKTESKGRELIVKYMAGNAKDKNYRAFLDLFIGSSCAQRITLYQNKQDRQFMIKSQRQDKQNFKANQEKQFQKQMQSYQQPMNRRPQYPNKQQRPDKEVKPKDQQPKPAQEQAPIDSKQIKEKMEQFKKLSQTDQSKILGNLLIPKIKALCQNKGLNENEFANKITGMLVDLSVFQIDEILEMLDSESELKERFDEAVELINEDENDAKQ